MRAPIRDALIGLTAIGGLLVLAWMLMRFGELAGVGKAYGSFVLRVQSARGISPVAPVSYSGVRVGEVTGISLAGDGSGDALIAVRFRAGAQILSGFTVFRDSTFVGDAVIDLIPPGDASAEVIAGEGEVYPVVIRSLVGDLTEQFNARLGRFEQTAESLETLARTYDDVGRRLAEVIDSPEPGVRDLRTTIDEVDRFAADSRALVDDVRETAEVWKASAAEITDQSRRLTDRAGQTLGTMDSAAAELREIAARLNRGEGTLGQLATNPDLFRSLQTAAEELRGLLRDARLLVEKYRDEGLPVNIF